MVARAMRLSRNSTVAWSERSVLLAVDAHLALEGPAAVGEVQSRGARMLGLHARASLRYDDVAEHQRVGAVVDLGRGRIEVDRLVGGRRRRRRRLRGGPRLRRRGRPGRAGVDRGPTPPWGGTRPAPTILTARDAPSTAREAPTRAPPPPPRPASPQPP